MTWFEVLLCDIYQTEMGENIYRHSKNHNSFVDGHYKLLIGPNLTLAPLISPWIAVTQH